MCRRFDADGVIEEVKLVEIHLDDFLFRIVSFKLHGDGPLHGFLNESVHQPVRLGRIELLRKLLRYRTAAAGVLLAQQDCLEQHSRQRHDVNAGMLHEALVLCGYQRIDYIWGNLGIVGIHSVVTTLIETSHLNTIGCEKARRKAVFWIEKSLYRWHIAYISVINHNAYKHHKRYSTKVYCPQCPNHFLCSGCAFYVLVYRSCLHFMYFISEQSKHKSNKLYL